LKRAVNMRTISVAAGGWLNVKRVLGHPIRDTAFHHTSCRSEQAITTVYSQPNAHLLQLNFTKHHLQFSSREGPSSGSWV